MPSIIMVGEFVEYSKSKSFAKNKSYMDVCEIGLKLIKGMNKQEVALVPRKQEKKGFFEKFFHFFN